MGTVASCTQMFRAVAPNGTISYRKRQTCVAAAVATASGPGPTVHSRMQALATVREQTYWVSASRAALRLVGQTTAVTVVTGTATAASVEMRAASFSYSTTVRPAGSARRPAQGRERLIGQSAHFHREERVVPDV